MIHLNHTSHTFQVEPFEEKNQSAIQQSGQNQDGYTFESRGTGERREAFGFRARHIIREGQRQQRAASPRVETRILDGWYIDLPFSIECGSAAGDRSGTEVAIEETLIDHVEGGVEQRIIDRVTEISEKPLDPALFSIPHGYHDVNSWRESVKEFFSGP